jgi:putative ATP-binding cassette transporter
MGVTTRTDGFIHPWGAHQPLQGSCTDTLAAHLQVDALTLRTPNNANTLIQGLTFTVAEGEQLLIMGPSGSGKTSLLRALAGLWQSGAGSIRRQTAPSAVFFVPQRPYMVLGSLRCAME